MKMRNRIVALLLCLSMGAALVACGENHTADSASGTQSNTPAATADSTSSAQQRAPESENDNMVNPWVDAENQDDAQQQAGLTIQLPSSLPAEYGAPTFRVIPDDILETNYAGNGDAEICIRKAVGTEDPSGDYNQYSGSQQVKVGDMEVTMKGNDGGVSLAVWQDGSNAYSIGIYDAAGITVEEMTQMVSEMLE